MDKRLPTSEAGLKGVEILKGQCNKSHHLSEDGSVQFTPVSLTPFSGQCFFCLLWSSFFVFFCVLFLLFLYVFLQ